MYRKFIFLKAKFSHLTVAYKSEQTFKKLKLSYNKNAVKEFILISLLTFLSSYVIYVLWHKKDLIHKIINMFEIGRKL